MKLRLSERSYQQRNADGNPLAADEFAFSMDGSEIVLPCRGGRFQNCIIRITCGEAVHPVWHWDGNREAPTLTPSIGCDSRCGWHGNITKGEIAP